MDKYGIINLTELGALLGLYRQSLADATKEGISSSMIIWSSHIAALNDLKKSYEKYPSAERLFNDAQVFEEDHIPDDVFFRHQSFEDYITNYKP